MSAEAPVVDPNAAEPLEQVEKQDPAASGGTGVESAAAQEGETLKPEEAKDKPRLPAGLLKELAELREDRRLLRTLLAERVKPEETKPPAQELKEPNPDDYDGSEGKSMADYLRDVRAYDREIYRRDLQTELQKADQRKQGQEEQEAMAAEWDEQDAAAQKALPDYKEVTKTAFETLQTIAQDGKQGQQAAITIAHTIQYGLENGPKVLHYLGQHPDEMEALVGLHPTRIVAALGRIEARLAPEGEGGEEKTPPQTKAPKPPTPIRKTAAGPALDPDKPEDAERMTPEEWRKAREAKLRGR